MLNWLNVGADEAAKLLLGCKLIREVDGKSISGRIVETEAYSQDDPASHTFKGRTPRNAAMFGPAGQAYVYFTYGMYFCLNVVCGESGFGSAVLIRALDPLEGIRQMEKRRGQTDVRRLASGPGKLCQAMDIDRQLNEHDLSKPPLRLERSQPVDYSLVVCTTRIGISRSQDMLRRFYIKDNPFVSKL